MLEFHPLLSFFHLRAALGFPKSFHCLATKGQKSRESRIRFYEKRFWGFFGCHQGKKGAFTTTLVVIESEPPLLLMRFPIIRCRHLAVGAAQ